MNFERCDDVEDGGEAQPGHLVDGLQRVLSTLFSVLRRDDEQCALADSLTLSQLSILLTLLDRGPMSMSELAAHERVRTPTTTVAIRRLERLGRVTRSRSSSDQRVIIVDITDKGRAEHRDGIDSRRAALIRRLGLLGDADIKAIAHALAPLGRLADNG